MSARKKPIGQSAPGKASSSSSPAPLSTEASRTAGLLALKAFTEVFDTREAAPATPPASNEDLYVRARQVLDARSPVTLCRACAGSGRRVQSLLRASHGADEDAGAGAYHGVCEGCQRAFCRGRRRPHSSHAMHAAGDCRSTQREAEAFEEVRLWQRRDNGQTARWRLGGAVSPGQVNPSSPPPLSPTPARPSPPPRAPWPLCTH